MRNENDNLKEKLETNDIEALRKKCEQEEKVKKEIEFQNQIDEKFDKEKIKSKKKVFFQIVLIVSIIGIVFSSIFFGIYMSKQLFLERSFFLEEICEKSAKIVDDIIDTSWDEVDFFKNILKKGEINDVNELLLTMEKMDTDLVNNNAHFIAIDCEGKVYSNKSKQAFFIDESIINDMCIANMKLPYMKNEDFVVCVKVLSQPIVLNDGTQITYIAIALNKIVIEEALYVSVFSNDFHIHILDSDNNTFYQQGTECVFQDDKDVLASTAEQVFVNGGTAEDLYDAVENSEHICIEFEIQGISYYVSATPMDKEDWTLLMYVPTKVLNSHTTSSVTVISLYFAIVAIFGILITLCISVYAVNSINHKKIMEQKNKNNQLLIDIAKAAGSANIAKSNFISHMSHDIRTPINGIIGMTNIAKTHCDNPKRVKECLDKISGSSNHLLSLINDVLDMSRIESGKVSILDEPFNINEMIDNCVSILDGQMEELEFNLDVIKKNIEHEQFRGDELHTRQILINILGNAVKFTPKRRNIIFEIEENYIDDDEVLVKYRIQDNGIGMSEEFVKHIFEPFAQERVESRTNYIGTGLGMAITKKFVDLLDGNISVTSVLNEGSCFVVEIPYKICKEKVKINESVNEIDVQGMKVLLVEDNELNLEIAQLMLEENGVSVTTAADGQIAVELFRDSEPYTYDAILMDIMMPNMDGLVATRIIRCLNNRDAKSIPIIAMTANAYQEDIRKTKKAGMNEHISKPIDIHLLLETLTIYNTKKMNK